MELKMVYRLKLSILSWVEIKPPLISTSVVKPREHNNTCDIKRYSWYSKLKIDL
tara:strand:+ start:263 stop:424 length:162 start_codon:yes stop_codon:yes gene_type:complete